MDVTGGCFCGTLRYQACVNENLVLLCHCTNCQRHSGSAYRVVVGIANDNFKLTSGEFASYEQAAESGSLRSRTYCPDCGTNIYAKTIGEGLSFWGLRVGTVDQRKELAPVAQIWTRSAQPWAIIDSLPQYEMQPTTEEFGQLMQN